MREQSNTATADEIQVSVMMQLAFAERTLVRTVNAAATCSGPTYPLVKHSSSAPPAIGLPAVATYASSVASTGVEHGEAASAKVRPAK